MFFSNTPIVVRMMTEFCNMTSNTSKDLVMIFTLSDVLEIQAYAHTHKVFIQTCFFCASVVQKPRKCHNLILPLPLVSGRTVPLTEASPLLPS